jgi:hypothetical protein
MSYCVFCVYLRIEVFKMFPIMCLRSEFRVVMSGTISTRLFDPQVFVGGLMSYLCYLIFLGIVEFYTT